MPGAAPVRLRTQTEGGLSSAFPRGLRSAGWVWITESSLAAGEDSVCSASFTNYVFFSCASNTGRDMCITFMNSRRHLHLWFPEDIWKSPRGWHIGVLGHPANGELSQTQCCQSRRMQKPRAHPEPSPDQTPRRSLESWTGLYVASSK